MNKKLIAKTKTALARAAAATLIVFGSALAISALTAESPTMSPSKRGECKDWPPEADKPKFEAGFNKALEDSATDKTLRGKLLKSDASAKKAVEDILDQLYPGQKLRFPPKAVIKFYEPEQPVPGWSGLDVQLLPNYPSDHCLHIFFLPEEGPTAGSTPSFRKNLMCCYKPW
jgi:hypothetical protein